MNSLYIHIPFCERKCFYCSFAVAVSQEHRMEDYTSALEKEAAVYQGETLNTVYLGGGTPSMLSGPALERLFGRMRKNFHFSENCEVTVEANPENLNLQKAELLIGLGVNRVSLGLQTLNDRYLKYLGRAHDSFKALSAFNDLRRAGFRNINVDLMYSFPGQTPEEIEEDVKLVLGLRPEHVSIYTLTVEENSKFFAQKITEQENEKQSEQFELVTGLLDEAGIKQYEVSNFSRPGFGSKHNLNYWQSGNYIGLGMSSHGHRDGRRSWNVSRLADYLKKVEAGESPEEGHEILTADQRLREALIFGLRMNQGVSLKALEERFSAKLPEKLMKQIDDFVQNGLLYADGTVLRTTSRGRLVLDSIAVYFV